MKQDNRGASLIEIIVAIAILVLCAVPLFKSMNLSAMLNMKSRQLLAATGVAEELMESLKADGMEQFIKENAGSTQIEEVAYLDAEDKSKGYRFAYPAYQMDTQTFRVEVEVRPYESTDITKDYNSSEVVNINRMNKTTDAIYTQNAEIAENDYLKAVAKGEYHADQREEVLNNLEIHYDYEIEADKKLQRIEQTITYYYNGKELGKHLSLLYDSHQARGTLYSLYIFFEPGKKNVINITNKEDYPLDTYLIKQGEKEMDLTVNLIGTSLMQNLGEERDPNFSKGVRLKINYKDTTDSVTYSYTQKNVQKELTNAELEKYFGLKALDAKEEQCRLYDVTIKVIKDTKQITELTGTVSR